MNPTPELDRVFPLSSGSTERARLRAPRVLSSLSVTPGVVLGHRAFMRAWAARRAALAQSVAERVGVSRPGESLTASATQR
jgi:hypothetical protein